MDRLIIDTDPGQDDALALLVALGSPELDVLGVTTVAGNVPVTQTADNARRILELAGRGDVPVYAGAQRPLLRPPRPVPEIHGATGIDGWDWAPAQRAPEPTHAVDWLVATLLREPVHSISLIALAPQTNIALALRRAPEIAPRLKRIVFMGGGYFEGGNMTPAAEYNILVDPEAAAIVLAAGIDITAVPLDCTHSAPAPIDWSQALEALGTGVGKPAAEWCGSSSSTATASTARARGRCTMQWPWVPSCGPSCSTDAYALWTSSVPGGSRPA